MLGYRNVKFRSCKASVCVHKEQCQEMLCKPQHNQTWVGAKLGHAFNCAHSLWYAEEGNLCCVALAVSFPGFHSDRRQIC